jgi:hypothetical protein
MDLVSESDPVLPLEKKPLVRSQLETTLVSAMKTVKKELAN